MSKRAASRSTVFRMYLIVGLFVAIIVILVALFKVQMDAFVAIRVFVGGEGLWAKAQKDSVSSLQHYAVSHNEADYQNFLRMIEVPLGYRKARMEIQKPEHDLDVVRKGLIRGHVHPIDMEYAIPFFLRFQHTAYMSRVIEHWTKADQHIVELVRVAAAIHTLILSRRASPETIRPLLDEIVVINGKVTEDEDTFSSTLAEASRWANDVSRKLTYSIALLFTVLGAVLSWPIVTRIRAAEVALQQKIKELIEAQEELVRTEKLSILGQLSGSVGHELRNPLAVMNNAVYFLKIVLTEADGTTKEYLDIIKQEIETSQRIIDDMLGFARTKKPQARAITVKELVTKSLAKCAIPGNVALHPEIPETLPRLHIDPLQVAQVLVNIITNAFQAIPGEGSVRVSARLTRHEKEKSSIVPASDASGRPSSIAISVTDTGEGISPENRKKLFQPLFTTKAKGIGLGLVVCKNLVEANGGNIEIESEVGKGTTFTLILPTEESEP